MIRIVKPPPPPNPNDWSILSPQPTGPLSDFNLVPKGCCVRWFIFSKTPLALKASRVEVSTFFRKHEPKSWISIYPLIPKESWVLVVLKDLSIREVYSKIGNPPDSPVLSEDISLLPASQFPGLITTIWGNHQTQLRNRITLS